MPEPIRECTDKELDKAIKVLETEIRKDKENRCSDEDFMRELAKGTRKKEEHLQKLYSERLREERNQNRTQFSPFLI